MADQDAGLFSEDLTFIGVDAPSREGLFDFLEEELTKRDLIQPTWREAIGEREASYATGLAFPDIPVAIPHVDPEHIKTPYIAVVKPSKPVTFEAMAGLGGDVDAELVVNLGVMRDGGQVQVLQKLMNIFQDQKSVERLLAQEDAASLSATFKALFDEASAL